MKEKTINILHFEDNADDVFLVGEILSEMKNSNCRIRHAVRLQEGLQQLSRHDIDIILLDLNLPDSRGRATFTEVRKVAENIPIIIMSGLADEDLAVSVVQEGAQDYLIKGQLGPNLLFRAILYAIERQKLLVELRQALEQIRTLRGLLPICCHCKDIRDDEGYWHQIEDYIHNHSAAEFSHGICPECAEKHYPEWYSKKERKKKTTRKKNGK